MLFPAHASLQKRGMDLSIGTIIELFVGIMIVYALFTGVLRATDLIQEDTNSNTLNSFRQLSARINALLQEKSNFSSLSSFPLYLADKYLIIGFDTHWQTSPVPNRLGNYHFYYATPIIFTKPPVCEKNACICLYEGDYDKLIHQQKLIQCSVFTNANITFSALLPYSSLPSAITGSERNDVSYEPFITITSFSPYHFFIYGKPGVTNFYLEKYITHPGDTPNVLLFLSPTPQTTFNGQLRRITERGNYLQFCGEGSATECTGKHYNQILTVAKNTFICLPNTLTSICTYKPITSCAHSKEITEPCLCQGDGVYTSGYCYNNWHYDTPIACTFDSCDDYEKTFGDQWQTYCTRDPCKLDCYVKTTSNRFETTRSCESK